VHTHRSMNIAEEGMPSVRSSRTVHNAFKAPPFLVARQ